MEERVSDVSAVLPSIMNGDLDAHPKVIVAAVTCPLSLLALATLWRRRPHSVLDLWVMVVLTAWIFVDRAWLLAQTDRACSRSFRPSREPRHQNA